MINNCSPWLIAHIQGISCQKCQRSVARGVWVLLALSLAGCLGLVRPNFEAEIVNLRPGNYSLDPDHTFVLFRIDHLGLSQVIGRFNEVEANLEFDPDDIEAMQLDGRIATASIDVGNEEFESQLRSASWLSSEQFPDARFTTESVTADADGNLTILGQFSLRGVTLPLQMDGRFNGGADNILTGKYTLGFAANGVISRKSYGIDDFGALVGDDIEIEIQAEFQQL